MRQRASESSSVLKEPSVPIAATGNTRWSPCQRGCGQSRDSEVTKSPGSQQPSPLSGKFRGRDRRRLHGAHGESLSVEVHSVHVHFGAHAQQIPVYFLAAGHHQSMEVTVHHAIDPFSRISIGVSTEVCFDVLVQVPGLVFVMHHKEQSELLLHVIPQSVGPLASLQSPRPADHQRPQKTTVQILKINRGICPRSFLAHEQRSHQSRAGVPDGIGGRVVQVGDAGRIRWRRTLYHLPGVAEVLPWSHVSEACLCIIHKYVSNHFPVAFGTISAVANVAGNRLRTSVRWPRSSSEQRPDQSRGDVPGGVKVGVVDPGQAVGIVICGGKFWSDLPAFPYGLWNSENKNSMRMHGVAPGCKVIQVDDNNFINLSSQYRPQEAQPGRSGGQDAVFSTWCVIPSVLNDPHIVNSLPAALPFRNRVEKKQQTTRKQPQSPRHDQPVTALDAGPRGFGL
ncbi:hypothetical protein F7725_006654 [Dissostichus mawsoni]|uniref:Uncharacterized protein n=1 Tax=Dissostichus mawsoni TaxID=36200 RepID=A0A7J5XUK7_DISMA|nr:hypothetical protein F7725_006654 [Dissostichus mawsoni]